MKIWITSDTHFLHQRVLDSRSPELQYKVWMDMISKPKEDIIIVVGDVCVGKDDLVHKHFVQEIRARMWLVMGNHDNKPIHWYLERGWDFVAHEMTIRRFGERFLFTHIPQGMKRKCTVNVHGHVHSDMRAREFEEYNGDAEHKFLNVTPEAVGGLVELEQLPKLIRGL